MNNRLIVIIVAVAAMAVLAYFLPNTAEVWIGGIIGVIVASILASNTLQKRYGKGKNTKNRKPKK